MTRHHVGEQPYDQCKRLDKNTQKLNRNQDRFNKPRAHPAD